jgi:hypothetical protein
MKYQLIVMDIDGTVLKSNHNVSQQSKSALDQARAKGVHVTLASGRNYTSMLHIALKLGIEEPLISNDGALIKHAITGDILQQTSFEAGALAEILEEIHKQDLTYTVHFEDVSITNRKINYLGFVLRMGFRAIAAGFYEKGARKILDHQAILEHLVTHGKRAYKVSTIANDPEHQGMEKTANWIRKHHADSAKISYSGLKNFEILPAGVSKANALEVLQHHYHIEASQIIAFGDSYNDLEMLTHAGFGVAMGNASEQLKNTADFVTKSNDAHGVAYAIKKFVLDEEVDG